MRRVGCEIRRWPFVWAMLAMACVSHASHTYYFDPDGDDSASGKSAHEAWKTLGRLESVHLGPGDRIELAEGEFEGSILIKADEGGSSKRPIVICSSKHERATIVARQHAAIMCLAGGVEIRDLELKGGDDGPRERHDGIDLFANGEHGERHRHVRIENVDISGFGGAGITLGALNKSHSGFEDVRIEKAKVHDNFGEGITSFDSAQDWEGYAFRGIEIVDCRSDRNGGTGIGLSCVDRGQVELCRASDNKGSDGAVGMSAWASRNVTFKSCIVSGTRAGGGQGTGFDLDGGCVSCSMEDCLAFDNDGPGMMVGDFPGAPGTRDNKVRYCISYQNGRRPESPGAGIGFVTWGPGVERCSFENCLAAVRKSEGYEPTAAFFASYVPGSEQKGETPHMLNCTIRNCVAMVQGVNAALVRNELPTPSPEQVRFVGNWYLTRGVFAPVFIEGDNGNKRYENLQQWVSATGQEMERGKRTVRHGQPKLPRVEDWDITEPRELGKMEIFRALRKLG